MTLLRACVVGIVVSFSVATAAAPAVPESPDSYIAHAMAFEGIPGLQAVAVKNGKVAWAKSYGDAVLEQPGPRRAMQNDSVLTTASLSKILVTFAVLQQMEQGKLKLDDDIGDSVPFRVRNPKWPEVPITWRMLLTHTSSIDETDSQRALETTFYGRDPPMTMDDYLRGTFTPGSRYYWSKIYRAGKPGTERIYSDTAFVLLAMALQHIVQEPFDQYIQHAILDPLKMTHTGVWLKQIDPSKVAVGYTNFKDGPGHYRFAPNRVYWAHGTSGGKAIDHFLTCPDYPAGCYHSTAMDFARLLVVLTGRGSADGVRILAPSSVELMMTPTGFRNRLGWEQGTNLFGLFDTRARQVWGHDGEDYDVTNSFFFNPKTGVGAVIFTNSQDPDWTQVYAVDDLDFHLMSWFE